jgi:hypothetical protein
MISFVYRREKHFPSKKKGVVMDIPKDPFILLSFINLKLRDEYNSLEDLCLDLQLNKDELCQKLQAAGFEYQESQKQFR